MKSEKSERVLRGLGVSPGIAIGPAHLTDHGAIAVPDYELDPDKVAAERERFDAAVAASVKQLRIDLQGR